MTAPRWDTVCAMLGCLNQRVPGSLWCEPCAVKLAAAPTPESFALKSRVPELFDPLPAPVAPAALSTSKKPRARRQDRTTSHRAAHRADRGLTGKQRAVLGLFRELGRMHDELLVKLYRERRVEQLALGFGPILPDLTDSSIRTRRAELVRLGYVRDTGHETTTARGGPTTVWEAMPAAELPTERPTEPLAEPPTEQNANAATE